MKSRSAAFIILTILVLHGCRRKADSAREFKVPHISCSAVPGDGRKMAKPYPKGAELYSWRAPEGTWCFSLLIGGSAAPGHETVTAKQNTIVGLDELKEGLALLAEGERVTWWESGGPLSPGHENLVSYPPQEVVDELVAYCRRLGISLSVVGD